MRVFGQKWLEKRIGYAFDDKMTARLRRLMTRRLCAG
jgi:hypothetical protein